MAASCTLFAGTADPSLNDNVFGAPSAAMTPVFRENVPAPKGPLRILTVEERVGQPRSNALVRVPLFFHAGECKDPHRFLIVEESDTSHKQPIPYQADDIRRDTSGEISRMHLYFETSLQPWEQKRFQLVPGKNPGTRLDPIPMKETSNTVTFSAPDITLTFWTRGPKAGAIANVQTPLGPVTLPDSCLAPRALLLRQESDCSRIRETPFSYDSPDTMEIRDLRWGAGPLLAKLIVRVGPKGIPDSAEYTYHIPRSGSFFLQTARFFPEEGPSSNVVGTTSNVLLEGRFTLGTNAADQQVMPVPAGLRRLTRWTHGHANYALVNPQNKISLLVIPYTQMGVSAITSREPDTISFNGPTTFQRNQDGNSDTIRAFWTQCHYVFSRSTTEEDLWLTGLPFQQTLTAIVDEPGLTQEDLFTELSILSQAFPKIQNWGRGWQQTAAMYYMINNTNAMLSALKDAAKRSGDTNAASWLPDWARVPEGQKVNRPTNKKVDCGRLDPYSLTYGATAMVPLANAISSNTIIDQIAYACGKASRIANEGTDRHGFPFIQCFWGSFNMQVGSVLLGIYGGQKCNDPDLVTWYRDVTHQPGVLGIYGRGQRSYSSLLRLPLKQSDLLYEGISDLYLRTIELNCNEDLWLHPAVYGRYWDCIDVMADLQHASLKPDSHRSLPRANFFRGQSHDHRWEGWDAAPYVGLLRQASGNLPGLTESCYYTRHRIAPHINWAELFTYFHTRVNLEFVRHTYRPPQAPPLPDNIQVLHANGTNTITWNGLPDKTIAGYRLYCANQMGGPWVFVNSPYANPGASLIRETSFTDTSATPTQVYFVTAVNSQGYESRWFPDEPLPQSGTNTMQ